MKEIRVEHDSSKVRRIRKKQALRIRKEIEQGRKERTNTSAKIRKKIEERRKEAYFAWPWLQQEQQKIKTGHLAPLMRHM